MLAAVEDEKQAPVAQKADDAVGRIGMVHDKPERPATVLATSVASFSMLKIEKTHLAVEFRPHVMGQRDRNGRLADSARTL